MTRSGSRLKALTILLALLGMLSAASCDSSLSSASKNPFPTKSPVAPGKAAAALPTTVTVTVKGAVKKPGVYVIDREANVAEAIVQAGGLTTRGTLQNIDLQGKLTEGMTLVVHGMPVSVATKPTPGLPAVPAAAPVIPAPVAPLVVPVLPAAVPSPPSMVQVTVNGAVAKPGTYRVFAGETVTSAIIAAGGPTASAVMGDVNLNQPLRNGMILTIPANPTARGAVTNAAAPPLPVMPAAIPSQKTDTETPLDINHATAEQLQRLPGIGPSLAARIVAYRKEVGAFRTPEQLQDVKGITPEKFSLIQSLVRTN